MFLLLRHSFSTKAATSAAGGARRRLIPAADTNAGLGAQLFGGQEAWKEQVSQAANNTEDFQFRNRRGRLPAEENKFQKLAERFGPELHAKHEFLFGRHAVELALRYISPSELQEVGAKVYIQDGSEEQREHSVIRQLARAHKIPFEITSKMRMDQVCKGESHQGVFLDLPRREFTYLDSDQALDLNFTADTRARREVILCLDEFLDAKTLGAVLRSALFFNVFAVVISAKNSAALDPLLHKAAAGASILLHEQGRMFATHNMVRTLQAQRRAGWKVVAASNNNNSYGHKRTLVGLDDLPEKVVLVCGDHRETGELRTLVQEQCSEYVQPRVASHLSLALPESPRALPPMSIPLSQSNLIAALLSRLN